MPLDEYRRKRDPARTPEPVGSAEPTGGGDDTLFVVQEHHARSLHWDLRLERDGVLVSWAVPKGLPNDTDTVRLAIHTEDHPVEYARFSGEIPRGEYGAGRMSVWDRGRYDTLKWTDSEVQVVLHGQRARGRFVLVRRGRRPNEWLLRRLADPGDLADPARQPLPATLAPMLAVSGALPEPDEGWCYEVRFGGSRVLARVDGGRVELLGPPGAPLPARHPELAGLGAGLGTTAVLLDGEIDGTPPGLWITDLLHLDGQDLTPLPYRRRRELAESLPLTGPAWRLVAEQPAKIVAVMDRRRRRGKVLIDWSQNNPAKTTVASYSLRGGRLPTVATPLTWAEVQECRRVEQLVFTADRMPDRLSRHGDLLAPLRGAGHRLPARD